MGMDLLASLAIRDVMTGNVLEAVPESSRVRK